MTDNQTPSNPSPKPKLPSNFNALTFTAPCPSCGAPVEFASVASVMAVCAYCQTTVIREGESLKAQGKQSLTIEDYSPLQIGSVGRFDGNDFAIIGRIQYRYEQGVWNEWYLQFSDGRTGWLSEALGQYSITFEGAQSRLPPYSDLAINDTVTFNDVTYQVTDRRSAEAIAGEGELPYVVGDGWQTWAIDAQFMRQFITLDYGESGEESWPTVYEGQAVELDALDMQLLKDERQIQEQVGQASGGSLSGQDAANSNNAITVSKIDCPNCGSPIPYIEGRTDFLICPTCHTESRLEGHTAEMLEMHSAMQHFDSTLSLGAKARIDASDLAGIGEFATSNLGDANQGDANNQSINADYHDYVVIGIMRLQEVGENARWTEYLLYSLTDGFLWLSEESGGWYVSRVLSEMPQVSGNKLIYDNREWQLLYQHYQNKVLFAIGAFNWQVKVNDQNTLMDYGYGDEVITSEQTEREITYTIAKPLDYSKLKAWFGDYLTTTQSAEAGDSVPADGVDGNFKKYLKLHFFLQFIILLFNGGSIINALVFTVILFIVHISEASNRRKKAIENGPSFSFYKKTIVVLSLSLIATGAAISFGIGMATSTIGNLGTGASSNSGGVILVPGSGSSSSGRGGFSSSGSGK